MNEYTINSIESLCNFIKAERPNLDKLNELLWHLGIRVIILDSATADDYCNLIKDYWQQWESNIERPLFISKDLEL